jgi:type IV pilus assembly protein PilM
MSWEGMPMVLKEKRVLGLDIGTYSIKAVELDAGGDEPVITNFGKTRVKNPQAVVDALREVRELAGTKTRKVVTAVSGRSVIVRYIQMRRMSDGDLRNAIRFEAKKYIPFDTEEIVLDCQSLDGNGHAPAAGQGNDGDQMRVLLVAVKKSTVSEQMAVLREAGMQPVVIDVDGFALGNAWELNRRGKTDAAAPVALVDIGANKASINILVGRSSYFTREVYVAGNDFSEAISRRMELDLTQVESLKRAPGDKLDQVREATLGPLDDLGNEIRLSLDYFENQFEQEVSEVLVSGGGAALPWVQEELASLLAKPVRPWDPLENVTCQVGSAEERFRCESGQFAVAVGLAARAWGQK